MSVGDDDGTSASMDVRLLYGTALGELAGSAVGSIAAGVSLAPLHRVDEAMSTVHKLVAVYKQGWRQHYSRA